MSLAMSLERELLAASRLFSCCAGRPPGRRRRAAPGAKTDYGWRSLDDFELYRAALKSDAMWEPIDEKQKEVVWYYRQRLQRIPEMMPKLLLCVDWQQPRQVERALRCISEHKQVPWNVALQLLDARFPHASVRLYAVHSLRGVTDEQLLDFLLQLVQTLKFESNHDNPVARFLLSRALRCPKVVGHRLFWTLRSELHNPMLERFGLLLKKYLKELRPADFALVGRESRMLETVVALAHRIKESEAKKTEEAAERQTALLRSELGKIAAEGGEGALPSSFTLPLDPCFESSGLNVERCKVMGSAQRPLWLEFKNADPFGAPMSVILKTGDDLRQDILTLQILKVMDGLWKKQGLNLLLVPYRCVATGEEEGMVEVVSGQTQLQVMREGSGTRNRGFLTSTTYFTNWLKKQNRNDADFKAAQDRFLRSNAGYCVVVWVLGIG